MKNCWKSWHRNRSTWGNDKLARRKSYQR